MPLFKIAQGPWTLLLKGNIRDDLLEVYTNPEKMVYIQTITEQNGKLTKAACEFYKIYEATGDVNGFIQTLPRDILLWMKHSVDETHTFLILGSAPVSVTWEENVVLEQTDILLKKIEVGSSLLKEVARAYDVQLTPLSQSPENVRNAFFASSMLVPMLATSSHAGQETQGKSNTIMTQQAHTGALPGEFVLGTTQNGLLVKEPVLFFKKTLISGGRVEHRKHLLQIIAEGALFSNIPVVIMDVDNEFSIMRAPNPNPQHLREQKIEGDPIGFPLKEFLPFENLKIELSTVPPEAFVEILGLMHHELGMQFARFLREHSVTSIDEAKRILRQLPPSDNFTPFQVQSVIRLLTLLEQAFPNLFDGTNAIDEISKSWFQSIGRAGVVKLHNIPARLRNIMILTLMKGIYSTYARKGVSDRVKTLIVIPESTFLYANKNETALQKEFERLLSESNTQDVGFLLSAAHEIDLPPTIQNLCEAKLQVIGGRQVGVALAGRKNYRVTMRDTYSQPVVGDFFLN